VCTGSTYIFLDCINMLNFCTRCHMSLFCFRFHDERRQKKNPAFFHWKQLFLMWHFVIFPTDRNNLLSAFSPTLSHSLRCRNTLCPHTQGYRKEPHFPYLLYVGSAGNHGQRLTAQQSLQINVFNISSLAFLCI
jgi:hypothetical protein